MCGDRFSSSTTCSRWRHETELGRLDQSLSCRFWKVATHPSCAYRVRASVSVAQYSPSWVHSAVRSIPDVVASKRAMPTAASTASPRNPSAAPSTTPAATPARNIAMGLVNVSRSLAVYAHDPIRATRPWRRRGSPAGRRSVRLARIEPGVEKRAHKVVGQPPRTRFPPGAQRTGNDRVR